MKLGRIAGVAAAGALAAGLATQSAGASTTSPHTWIQQNVVANAALSANSSLTQYFLNQSGSYVYSNSITSKGVNSGLSAATVPLRYTSYADLQANIASHALPNTQYPAGSVLIYDPEGGTGWPTPANEKADPEYYMPAFNALAATIGDTVIETPGRDLGNTDTTCTASWSGLDNYYTACDIAGYAVQNGGRGVVVQDQADETDTTAYKALFFGALSDANAANSSAKVWTEVSDQRGTYQQANTAITSLKSGGVLQANGAFLQVQTGNVSSWQVPLMTDLFNEGL